MQDPVLDTLFLPMTAEVSRPKNLDILAVNVRDHSVLHKLSSQNALTIQQYFKPYADQLADAGLYVIQDLPKGFQGQDLVFIRGSKNAAESGFFIAQALRCLKEGGVLYVAAANDEGAGRYQKLLEALGLSNVQSTSKNKAKVAWGQYKSIVNEVLEGLHRSGDWQNILDDEFCSKPGVFGWNKEDFGSKMLINAIKDDIFGNIADFGCGYGYLSVNLIKDHGNIAALNAIDADYRALQACNKNLSALRHDAQYVYLWEDLTKSASLSDIDFVIMNPPFHEGKKTDSSIGQAFIKTAHKALKKGGKLWMVANAHLPYEDLLNQQFAHTQNVLEGQGFKVFRAEK